MNAHPAANIFPRMSAEEYQALKSDIFLHGVREPVWTYQGMLLDGRHREQACDELNIPCPARVYDGDDPFAFVVSLNLKRRHLNESQRSQVAAKIRDQLSANLHSGDLTQAAADLLNVSRRSVMHAVKVEQDGVPGLADAVGQGTVSVSAAAALADLPPAEQAHIVARGESEIIAAAKQIKRKKRETRIQKRVEAKADAAKKNPPLAGDQFKLLCADLSKADVAAGSIDAIITDPPYPLEYADCYDKLRDFAERTLKNGGHLVVMTGQANLYEFARRLLLGALNYQWTFAYLTPGQSTQVFGRGIKSNWKPVLWFVKGKKEWEHINDTVSSDTNDKRFHEWGQSVGGMAELVERFTVPNAVICDPFCGAGTTGIAAVLTNRFFIGIDKDQACVNTAAERLKEPQLVA